MSVKINEALYDMKERLQSVEEEFSKVSSEKEKMEGLLKEKVQMIRVCIHDSYSYIQLFNIPACVYRNLA